MQFFYIILITFSFVTICAPIQAQSRIGFLERLRELFGSSPRPIRQSSGKRDSGGSRDLCPETEAPLTALIPYTNLGLTISEHPTLWFYVPSSIKEYPLSFVLIDPTIDKTSNLFEETDFYTLPSIEPANTPGFLPIEILEPLEVGKQYQWVLSINCTPNTQPTNSINRSAYVAISGWIERVERPELVQSLESVSTEEKIEIYAKEGLWIDMLNTLAVLYQEQPENPEIETTWTVVLECFVLNEDEDNGDSEESEKPACDERRSIISSTSP